ncbi:Replication-associated recombination protein A [Providencia stuartii]|nr:Replication-associated recombination protein A [Providencia stuartii]
MLMTKKMLMQPVRVYFPPEMQHTQYYHPTNRGLEAKIAEKLNWLAQQDQNSPQNAIANVGNAVKVIRNIFYKII